MVNASDLGSTWSLLIKHSVDMDDLGDNSKPSGQLTCSKVV